MALAKLHLPQSGRLVFRNQASDLLTAAPFPNLNLFDVGHADSSSKSSHLDQMGRSDGYLEDAFSPHQGATGNVLELGSFNYTTAAEQKNAGNVLGGQRT